VKDELDATHDQALRSWVAAANEPETDFPIQNLPLGVFRRRGSNDSPGIGVAIGDRVVSLRACSRSGLLSGDVASAVRSTEDAALNRIMAEGDQLVRALRHDLVDILQEDNGSARRRGSEITELIADVELLLPVRIGDYSDFYASIHHATNVGSMFRPESPLLPNYKYVPIGYHGRASSIVVSGASIRRPSGQTREDVNAPPTFGSSRRLDYEIELGVYIGAGNPLGEPIPIARTREHMWGISLVNDWSARDIQSWEYQPLGPFLSKSFGTSVSPWVVTFQALAPFRRPAAQRPPGDPRPLDYLNDPTDQAVGGIDLSLEVWLRSATMRERNMTPMMVSRARFADMYWTVGQLVAHHASNGCNLQTGDLVASGTVSGATPESRGCLLERASRGTQPIELPTGERRAFLQDGDEVIMRGFAERPAYRRIGLGECVGVVISE
jgi:fumarylacetoacetase